ncbi:MAG: hypothetical protein WCD07_03170 [Burkholderiales bacterium]
MNPQQIPADVLQHLRDVVNRGDYTTYYETLAAYGHGYGNLAILAAGDTGFVGILANNFLEAKADEYGVSFDADKIRQDLMSADLTCSPT